MMTKLLVAASGTHLNGGEATDPHLHRNTAVGMEISQDLNAELVSSKAIDVLTPLHQHRTVGMFPDRVGHAPHEIFVNATSAARPNDDEVGPLAFGERDELSF